MLTFLAILLITGFSCMHAQIPEAFTTERTRVEKTTPAHIDHLRTIISNAQVQDAYNTTDESTFNDIAGQMRIINDQWEQHGYGLYTVFDRKTSQFLGFAGYHAVSVDDLGKVHWSPDNKTAKTLELYGLAMPAYWRQGYGFEVAQELIHKAFTHLPHINIITYIEPKNFPALQLAKKLNFAEETMVSYNDKPHILYRLQKTIPPLAGL